MITQVFGMVFFIILSYICTIFVAPTIADEYGYRELNAKIREFKDQSLQFASGGVTNPSVFDTTIQTTSSYLEDTKKTVVGINSNINTKVSQVQDVSIAVTDAYSGIVTAAQKIQNITGSGK